MKNCWGIMVSHKLIFTLNASKFKIRSLVQICGKNFLWGSPLVEHALNAEYSLNNKLNQPVVTFLFTEIAT